MLVLTLVFQDFSTPWELHATRSVWSFFVFLPLLHTWGTTTTTYPPAVEVCPVDVLGTESDYRQHTCCTGKKKRELCCDYVYALVDVIIDVYL